jgi:hypothetical protein
VKIASGSKRQDDPLASRRKSSQPRPSVKGSSIRIKALSKMETRKTTFPPSRHVSFVLTAF